MSTTRPASPIRILYLERDAGLASHVRATLEGRGHRVDLAESGDDGLARHSAGGYDVLAISDHPPHVDGLDVVRRLAAAESMPPTILVARHENVGVAVEAMSLGAADCVVKDDDGVFAHLLGPVVERALESHRLGVTSDLARRALRESEERLTGLTDQSLVGIAVWGRDGFVYANAALAEMTGRPVDDLLRLSPKAILAIVDPADRAAVEEVRQRSLTQDEPPPRFEYRIRRKAGETRWVEQHARRIRYMDTPAILLSFIDVTERRQAEEMRISLERQVLQTQDLESLGILAGGIAHDFNNLLMGVLGHAGMALRELPPSSPARAHLEHIQSAASRSAELTQQMLAYAGRGGSLVREIDLSQLLEGVSHLLRTSLSKKVTLELDLDRSLPPVTADATQIQQLVMSLVLSASEAIGGETGVITIRTGASDRDSSAPSGAVPAETPAPGPFVFLEVEYGGCGSRDSSSPPAFRPFFTTEVAGRSLTMATVQEIVRGHAGAILLDTDPGAGTTLRILFPAAGGGEKAGASPEPRAATIPRDPGTVLVVDDERLVRELAQLMLEREGFRVIKARDGIDAVTTFGQNRDEISCVLLDVTMPRMDGEEALTRIRQIDPEMPVLLASGHGKPEFASRFPGGEFTGFIQKPYQAPDLLLKIRAVLEDRT